MLMRFFIVLCSMIYSFEAFSFNHMQYVVNEKASSFSVTLPANPTTGYRWTLEQYDTADVSLKTNQYQANSTGRIGSGGQMVFVFTMKKNTKMLKSTHMRFRYARPWDSAAGEVTCVTIQFKPKND